MAHVELNAIEIYVTTNEGKMVALKNKETILGLIEKKQLKREKLIRSEMLDSCYNYWNGGRIHDPLRESLYVTIKHHNA